MPRFTTCRTALLAGCLVLGLSSCATRAPQAPPAPPSQPAGVPEKTAAPSAPAPPAALLIPVSKPAAAPAASYAPQPPPEPTRAEKIARLVTNGKLIAHSDNTLVFKPGRPTGGSATGGLYEDAILLARLRRQIKTVPGIPESVAATATIHDATAALRLDGDCPAALSARVIDAVLNTEGLATLRIILLSPLRS